MMKRLSLIPGIQSTMKTILRISKIEEFLKSKEKMYDKVLKLINYISKTVEIFNVLILLCICILALLQIKANI